MRSNNDENISWSPKDYQAASVIATESMDEMMSRLAWMTIKPSVVVDMGCGVGNGALRLQERYPNATVIALDSSLPMIEEARTQSPHCICAVAETLPLADHSVDIIFANLLLPWHNDPQKILSEWRRVLRPNGLLMFNLLGLDTLQEYRAVFGKNTLPQLVDMHDVGDELLKMGFSDPVLDVNRYVIRYRSKEKMLFELQASGMLVDSAVDLNTLEPAIDEAYQVTYEVIFVHAFGPIGSSSTPGEFKVPLSELKR